MLDEAIVLQLSSSKVIVVGDVMIDHYVHGQVKRVSPEAPVPVLHVSHERYALGGAANVVGNIGALGAQATLLGVVGNDPAALHLYSMLAEAGDISAELITCQNHPTIVKTRYLGDRQQIVRVDREEVTPYPSLTIESLIRRLHSTIEDCDVVVLSDYGKGVLCNAVLAEIFALAAKWKKPVIVDPKRVKFKDYAGATYITPNRKELEAAVNLPADSDEEALTAASMAIEATNAAILLTRSEKGMALFRKDLEPIHLSTVAKEVYDVSGAGDTVVATLAAALGAGLPIEVGMQLANAAAGIVVAKLGTSVCTKDELIGALELARPRHPAHVALSALGPTDWDEAKAQREAWRNQGLTVGFANGCFDLLHPGHVTLLLHAAAQVDRLIVAINSDVSVRELKGPTRPVQSELARAAVLMSIKGVDLVSIFSEPTPLELITHLMPDVLFKGSDYTEDAVVGGELVKSAGGRVVLIDLVEGHSTSRLVARAQS
jgi:D-beta-D-heptose 7-phosphate kinase/D-beta-D-heptose 1-phosphate adenosyltransferase